MRRSWFLVIAHMVVALIVPGRGADAIIGDLREEFARDKILDGVKKACQKRPVSIEQMEELVDRVEQHFQDLGEKEISAVLIGEKVVKELYRMDDVAYVRFASVYRSFKDVNEFMVELKDILRDKQSS